MAPVPLRQPLEVRLLPVLGWIAGAVDGAVSTTQLVNRIAKINRGIKKALKAAEDFIAAVELPNKALAAINKVLEAFINIQNVGLANRADDAANAVFAGS